MKIEKDWARDRARAVVNSVGSTQDAEAAIAAALQQVADECAEIADCRIGPSSDIRARFPRCPDAE